MKKPKKSHIVMVILLTLVIIIITINSIVICSITPQSTEDIYNLLKKEYTTDNVDICILDYDYVTGASWRVEKSTNSELESKYVCINTICNPRYLKINKEFDLDYLAKYVVVIDKKIMNTKMDNEDVNLLNVKELVITNVYHQNDGLDKIRFGELSLTGKLKSIISFFVPKLRVHT